MKKIRFVTSGRTRTAAVLLAALMTALTVSAYPVPTKAAADTIVDEMKIMEDMIGNDVLLANDLPNVKQTTWFQWDRIFYKEDLDELQFNWFLLTWGGENKDTYFTYNDDTVNGEFTGTKCSSIPGMAPGADRFLTQTVEFDSPSLNTPWGAAFKCADSKNENYPRNVIFANYFYSGDYFDLLDWTKCAIYNNGLTFNDVGWDAEPEMERAFTFITGDSSKSIEGNTTEWGCVRIFWEKGGGKTDYDFAHYGDKIVMTQSNTTNEEVSFKLFYATYKKVNIMPSMTVQSGTTLQLDGNIVLGDGCTLTVEPGAVVSVTGEFINNGEINNYGTVLLQEGANVYSAGFASDASNVGRINCYGRMPDGSVAEGNLIVLKGAQLTLPDLEESMIFMCDGTTCINNGLMVLPRGFGVADAEFINRADGYIWTGFALPTGAPPQYVYNSAVLSHQFDPGTNIKELTMKLANIDFNILYTLVVAEDLAEIYVNSSKGTIYSCPSLTKINPMVNGKLKSFIIVTKGGHFVNDGHMVMNSTMFMDGDMTGNGTIINFDVPDPNMQKAV